ncbi:hypothetical protein SLE2022_305170 [Rubroshorea leprosula]
MENMIMSFIFLPMLLMQSFITALAMSQPNLTTDQSALLEFKAHITSDPLNILFSNWSSATPVCNWFGVSCGDLHHRVTILGSFKHEPHWQPPSPVGKPIFPCISQLV